MPPKPDGPGPEDRWERVTRVFLELTVLEPDARQVRLKSATAGDPVLRDEIERLLAGHAASEGRFPASLDPERTARLLEPVEDGLPPGRRIGPYEIERQLGRGGMGVVYLAHDTRLGRAVALKIPPSYLAHDPVAKRRIMAEARAASALDHPRIATVYDIGETEDGRLYIAMAYCEGETLQERLSDGPLPVEEAVSIAAQIAAGLSVAHAHGIVHRDIKPGNVVVAADGSVRLVDFGIAEVAGTDLTGTGARLGTVAYMSPEQTRGDAVDSRTDLWALGVVLYEMLVGRHPFPAGSDAARIHAIRSEPAPALARSCPGLPDGLSALVERCLAKDPADRPPDAGTLLAGIEAVATEQRAGQGEATTTPVRRLRPRRSRIGVLTILASGLAGAVLFVIRGDDPAAGVLAGPVPAVSSQRLALLPFVGGPDTTGIVLAAGLTDELMERISDIAGIRVIARSSVQPLVREQAGMREIADRLGVDAVLAGSVRLAGSRIVVAAHLLEARTERPLWGGEYETQPEDLVALGDEIVQRVADAMGATRRGQSDPPGRGTESFEAYLNYLRGRYYWSQRTAAGIQRGKEHFEKALDIDPTYARAWSGLADAYILMGSMGTMKAEDAFPRGRAAAERALQVDPGLAEAHASLGAVLADYYWDWEGAERAFRRAIELDPDYVAARYWYSELLANLGRTAEALEMTRRAREVDPLSQLARADEGRAYYLARRYDEAIDSFRETLELGPQFVAQLYLGLAHSQAGRHAEAIAAMQSFQAAYPRSPEVGLLGYVYARAGRHAEARRVLEERTDAHEPGDSSPMVIAGIHSGLGDLDAAFEWLQVAYEGRAWQMVFLRQEPVFDPLRGDPRYADLLDRLGLGE